MRPFNQVVITEKQNQANRFIEAFGLNKKVKSQGGGELYYDVEGGMCVVPLSGHIIGLQPPEFYIAGGFKTWDLSYLPIIPKIDEFKFVVQDNPKAKRLLSGVKYAIKDIGTHEIIVASDNDKEGELLAWEVLEYIGAANHSNKTRMLYTEITVKAIKDAYEKRINAEQFRPRFFAGLARLFSDWLFGMNITMAMTVENKSNIPPRTVINSGRVIFAISYILYLKENEILSFKPQVYFNISAVFKTPGGNYTGKLIVDERFKDKQHGYLMDPNIAKKIVDVVNQRKIGKIVNFEAGEKKEGPPLGFDRTGFSSHMAKKFKMSLIVINDTMQALYDKHGLLTYPRVDVEHLDMSMHDKIPPVLDAMKKNILGSSYLTPEKRNVFEKVFAAIDATRKSRIFKKGVSDEEAHHAIIPTGEVVDLDKLTSDEKLMYEEACKRLIMQFLPDYIFHHTKITTKIVDAISFQTTGNIPKKLGWRIFDRPDPSDDDDKGTLPDVKGGDIVDVLKCERKEEKTKCPKRYTDDELLNVLKKPNKFIQNKELLKRIKKIEIGTSATRENHVTELQNKGYYTKKKEGAGKAGLDRIYPTKKLMAVIDVAPPYFLYPELSAFWEDAFSKIEKDITFFDVFMEGQYKILTRFFNDLKLGKFKFKSPIGDPKPCPDRLCGGSVYCTSIPKKKFKLWTCATCNCAWFDEKGKVGTKLGPKIEGENPPAAPFNPQKKAPCPKCKKSEVGFKPVAGKNYDLWQCMDTKCNSVFFDSAGKPGTQLKKKK